MKKTQKQYWKGLEQLSNDPEFVKHADNEFPEYLPLNSNKESGEGGTSRRDFLKMMGFSIAAASLAACEAPIRNAIPYLNKPVDVDPGIPNYYASTYTNGGDYGSIIVKTREGRPIKIDGNPDSPISQGGVSSQIEASVLGLYDTHRLRGPQKVEGGNATKTTWEELDKAVMAGFDQISAAGGQIAVVSQTVMSPSTMKALGEFMAKYPTAKHVMYDASSAHGMLKANQDSFGKAALPSYDFSKANVIVSFGADFLGTWLSPVEFTKQYSKTRKVTPEKPDMSRHFQFETNMSLTGSNADYRTPIKPSEQGAAVIALYNMVTGSSLPGAKADVAFLKKAADELKKAKGKGLVVAGSNDPAIQTLINGINAALGNYGTTIDMNSTANYRKGDDAALDSFVKDLNAGTVKGVVFFNCNPAYDTRHGAQITAGLAKAQVSVSTSLVLDETAAGCQYVAPDHHYLEAWGDAEPKAGHLSLQQPAISPLFKTREAQMSFLTWAGAEVEDYYSYVKANWKANYFGQQSEEADFARFWDSSLYKGFLQLPAAEAGDIAFGGNANAAASSIAKNYKAASGLELAIYEKVGIGKGDQANNPWLQEMPDPVTKATWDNYVTISLSTASELGIEMKEGNTMMLKLTANGQTVEVPAMVQPGQANGTVGIALGYGRKNAGKVGNEVGVNAFPMLAALNGATSFVALSGVSVEKTGVAYKVARTQTHQTYMGRENVIQEALLGEYKKNHSAGSNKVKIHTYSGEHKDAQDISLWNGHDYPDHHWGMVIDMNSCTGCGACTVACQVENNIPVVGKQEVLNRREMHWIRIDRYYSSQEPEEGAGMIDSLLTMEKAAENPEVTFQPIMCQQCNNAPCETVCPVAATTHSTEGLNQMTYNRCIGTRYCANNCPYKVRRFNWFKYHDNSWFDKNSAMNSDLGKMVLNPDVTVRARGVMEKCTFCVQRIQLGKLTAKKDGRRTNDSDVNSACASACPADAITFGDLKDSNSEIFKLLDVKEDKHGVVKVGNERAYHVLEELNVRPNVFYLRKIRNKDGAEA